MHFFLGALSVKTGHHLNKFSLVGRWWRTFYAYLETTLLSFTIAFTSLFYSDNEYTYNLVIDIDISIVSEIIFKEKIN